MDDLDFSKPARKAEPAYQPAVARAFFESLRGEVVERVGPGGGVRRDVPGGPVGARRRRGRRGRLRAAGDRPHGFLNLVKTDPTFGVSLLAAMAERLRHVAAAVN